VSSSTTGGRDPSIRSVGVGRRAAASLGCGHRRIISGAGHDAQYMATICPTGMIFVPRAAAAAHCEGSSPARRLEHGPTRCCSRARARGRDMAIAGLRRRPAPRRRRCGSPGRTWSGNPTRLTFSISTSYIRQRSSRRSTRLHRTWVPFWVTMRAAPSRTALIVATVLHALASYCRCGEIARSSRPWKAMKLLPLAGLRSAGGPGRAAPPPDVKRFEAMGGSRCALVWSSAGSSRTHHASVRAELLGGKRGPGGRASVRSRRTRRRDRRVRR